MLPARQLHPSIFRSLPSLRSCLSTRCFSSVLTCTVDGTQGTIEARYNFYWKNNPRRASPWHDIPLFSTESSTYLNFVNEVPRGSRAKMEVATDEPYNPIKQDLQKGAPRHYHFDSIVNYGCLPQTWEDPDHCDELTGFYGDNDPIDVCDIGERIAKIGEIYPIKVLGVLAMIDQGEMDWKVIGIAADDPLASELHDLEDVHKHATTQDKVAHIRDWFRDYKIPDGKPKNEFAFDGEAQDRAFALRIIEQTHRSWQGLTNTSTESKLWVRST